MEHYDLLVIGSGPAGEKGAAQAAHAGKRVALIERAAHMGGTGINTGTVPSKTLREAALFYSGLRQRGLQGIQYSLKENLSLADLMQREQVVTARERKLTARNLENHQIDLLHGTASFVDAHTVRVIYAAGVREVSGDVILIATGASPHRPPEFPFDGELIHDSDTILQLKRLPKTLAVVGAGVIGTEYASIFTALGVQVTLIEPRERMLPFVDYEMIRRLQDRLTALGLQFKLGHRILSVDRQPASVRLTLDSPATLEYDNVLVASGRQGNIYGLGLEQIGVATSDQGLIVVNDRYQTSVPHIYAAGDVIGFPALASTSMEQGRAAMARAFGLPYKEHITSILPFAVYAIPEISMVGLTEDECRDREIPHLIGRSTYEDNPRGQIIGDTTGMVKLIFSPQDKKLLGAHIIGEQASELIHIAAHVLMAHGTLDVFSDAVYNFPTLADAYKAAAYNGLQAWEQWRADNP